MEKHNSIMKNSINYELIEDFEKGLEELKENKVIEC